MSAPAVHLRMLEAADGPRVLAWRNSDAVAPFMYGDHAITPEEHAAWMAASARTDRRRWIVELDREPMGLASISGMDPATGRAEWAFYLAEPAVRGRGVGGAVERLVVGWAFEGRGLRKLWCEVLADNEAVWRMHEAFGFTREALLREHVVKGGSPRDVVGLGLLASEWPPVRARADARLAARGYQAERLTIDG